MDVMYINNFSMYLMQKQCNLLYNLNREVKCNEIWEHFQSSFFTPVLRALFFYGKADICIELSITYITVLQYFM